MASDTYVPSKPTSLESDGESEHRTPDQGRLSKTLDGHLRLLERERQKLSTIVNHADAGFALVDREQRIQWSNRVFRERFTRAGAPAGSIGLSCNQALCGASTICDDCPGLKPFESRSVSHRELRLWIDDRYHVVYITAMPVQSMDGSIEQVILMVQDVSDLEVLRQSEEALRTSEERFRSIFDRVTIGMVTTRVDGTFLQVNPAFCTMLGYTEKQLLRKTLVEVTDPTDAEETREQFAEVLRGERSVIEMDKRYSRRDGTTVWGRTTAVWQFENDQPLYAICVIQDVTERKTAEMELARSRRKYETLVESIDGIAWEADPESLQFMFVSNQVERILGFPTERWLTQRRFWRNRIHRDDLDRVIETYQKVVANLSGDEIEYRLMAEDGRAVWVRDRFNVVTEGDAVLQLRGIMVDITHQRDAETALRESEEQLRQSQKMDAVGRLAGGIAHDFNNLLTAITGYGDFMLRQLKEGQPLRREAEEIRKAARRAAALTSQLLAFSRQQVLMPQVLDLNAAVEDMEAMLRRVIGEDVELHVTHGDELGAVRADPGQIQQVMLNLSVNARDAMPEGGRLTLQTSMVELTEDYTNYHSDVEPGWYVVLAMSDTGCGMNEETKTRLFEPFFTTKETGKGTGLGLSTVYGIVKQSGGHIAAYSELRKGTTFMVYLPRVDEKPVTKEEVIEIELKPGTERILLVEDDAAVRELTHEILKMSGYTVLAAENGPQALEICENLEGPVDLMVTDLVMPQMGGRDLAKILVGKMPELRVLYMSGYTTSTSLQQGLLEPGAFFLQKPFAPDDLARRVREILDG